MRSSSFCSSPARSVAASSSSSMHGNVARADQIAAMAQDHLAVHLGGNPINSGVGHMRRMLLQLQGSRVLGWQLLKPPALRGSVICSGCICCRACLTQPCHRSELQSDPPRHRRMDIPVQPATAFSAATPDTPDPYFVNEQGTKWWRDHETTEHALGQGPGVLHGAAAFIVETPEGLRSHVLVRKGAVIAEARQPEVLATMIGRLRRVEYCV